MTSPPRRLRPSPSRRPRPASPWRSTRPRRRQWARGGRCRSDLGGPLAGGRPPLRGSAPPPAGAAGPGGCLVTPRRRSPLVIGLIAVVVLGGVGAAGGLAYLFLRPAAPAAVG